MAEYFRYQSIGFPFSPVEGIRQMEAGSWMRIKDGQINPGNTGILLQTDYDFDFTGKKEVQRKDKRTDAAVCKTATGE